MKPTVRGTLAAVITCVAAAAAGAVAASPAAAAGSVPVPVPLEGVENSLNMELPHAGAELPLPTPGSPEAPRYTEGRLLPDRALPQLPVEAGLPGADVRAPLPRVLGDDFDHAAAGAPASAVNALAPGASLDAPLTAPDAGNFGVPGLKPPQAGVLAPALSAVPAADLATGPGL
ncbi:hypothetical protein ACIQU5_05365 [Streptomyces sp. NPDC090306]|uniref:hypothetical protein n=1 Tax=Streptomyces sp. NPDC090306 TaxID=3365961 RepID=UPI0038130CF8